MGRCAAHGRAIIIHELAALPFMIPAILALARGTIPACYTALATRPM